MDHRGIKVNNPNPLDFIENIYPNPNTNPLDFEKYLPYLRSIGFRTDQNEKC